MKRGKAQFVWIKCQDARRVEELRRQAIGVSTLFVRWEMIPAAASVEYPTSLNVLIPDFVPEDLVRLRRLPGVVDVDTFESSTLVLPKPTEARREFWRNFRAA